MPVPLQPAPSPQIRIRYCANAHCSYHHAPLPGWLFSTTSPVQTQLPALTTGSACLMWQVGVLKLTNGGWAQSFPLFLGDNTVGRAGGSAQVQIAHQVRLSQPQHPECSRRCEHSCSAPPPCHATPDTPAERLMMPLACPIYIGRDFTIVQPPPPTPLVRFLHVWREYALPPGYLGMLMAAP